MSTTATTATLEHAAAPATGVWSWITTVDHKRIGILYGATALAFFLVGGIEALLILLQLARSASQVVSADTFNAPFTMHGTTMVSLAIMPFGSAVFDYLVPMIGARNNAGNAAWIVNPQAIKPGVNMPPHAFSAQDLNAINAYLTTWQ